MKLDISATPHDNRYVVGQVVDTQPYIYKERTLLVVKSSITSFVLCDSAGIRTLDPRLRRALL